ncbi:MAG: carbohydrate ABC transporter permease, partial [Planctomycetota bacterium]
MSEKTRRRLLVAWAFLLPNFIGFAIFTAGPVLFSLYMAFTDWSLVKHNSMTDAAPRFIGFENFTRLLWGDESAFFWDSFYNTVYLMLGIPLSIAGSLIFALLLNRPVGPRRPTTKISLAVVALLMGAVCAFASLVVTWPGDLEAALRSGNITTAAAATTDAAPETSASAADSGTAAAGNVDGGADDLIDPAPTITTNEEGAVVVRGITGSDLRQQIEIAQRRAKAIFALFIILGVVVALGVTTGVVFFRTLFYLPSLLAGIALFLLWKSLYKPTGGAINVALEPFINGMQNAVTSTPPLLWYILGIGLWIVGGFVSVVWTVRSFQRLRLGDSSTGAMLANLMLVIFIAATFFGLGYWLCQLPADALFTTGYAPLSAADLDALRVQLIGALPNADPREITLALDTLGDSVQPRIIIDSLIPLAPEAGSVIVEFYASLTPAVRDEARRVLLQRADWAMALLDGIESGAVPIGQLALDQKRALSDHPDPRIAERARALMAEGGGLPSPDRQ